MSHETHVYLGPTLDYISAQKILPNAYYHPPIKCGDLIRLLRLNPKRIVIIDGIYETIPTVWHKEIMLALDLNIEVFGAASMGALRAAELHPFGMIGLGQVFQDFLNQTLYDDDEVAVLHQVRQGGYVPINDAMVNIRATLSRAYQEQVISQDFSEHLLFTCKNQFYPYRSLERSIFALSSQFSSDAERLSSWLLQYGIVDIKKLDAEYALTYVSEKLCASVTTVAAMPVTKFIASLVDEAMLEPFDTQAAWLIDKEKKLQSLKQDNAPYFQLIQIQAMLMKFLLSVMEVSFVELDSSMLLSYIQKHRLYSPEYDFSVIVAHPKLSGLYPFVCQLVCQGHLSEATVIRYAPVLAFYFQIDYHEQPKEFQQLLRLVTVFLCVAHIQLDDSRLKVKSKVLADHFREQKLWPRLEKYNALHSVCEIDKVILIQFVELYMQVVYVYHGFRDVTLGEARTLSYFDSLYDALECYQSMLGEHTL